MKYDLYVITDEAIAGGLTHEEIARTGNYRWGRCYSVERQGVRMPGALSGSAGLSARLQ